MFQRKKKANVTAVVNTKSGHNTRKTLSTIFFTLLMLVGWYVMTYPLTADRLNRLFNINSITSYNDDLSNYTDDELSAMMEKTQEYNASIWQEQQVSTFHYRGASATDADYTSVPVPGSETIGSVEIPKLGINLTIVHGTKDANLQNSVGHLYGTSLPVAGDNVHSVLAAHSALASAELFTHIDKLEKGDTFSVTVLNEKYTYTVSDVTVCLPEDEAQYEQIQQGKNLCTLYTCTPYGINTYRLLVTGELTGEEHVTYDGPFTQTLIKQIIIFAAEIALIVLAPFIAVLILHLIENNTKVRRRTSGKAKSGQSLNK